MSMGRADRIVLKSSKLIHFRNIWQQFWCACSFSLIALWTVRLKREREREREEPVSIKYVLHSSLQLQNICHSNKYLVLYSQNAQQNTYISSHNVSTESKCYVLKNYPLQYHISWKPASSSQANTYIQTDGQNNFNRLPTGIIPNKKIGKIS
jgi:hypothetical protein